MNDSSSGRTTTTTTAHTAPSTDKPPTNAYAQKHNRRRPVCNGSPSVAQWWRGQDLNLRPSGYEPDELPSCSTPRRSRACTVANSHIHNNPPGSVDNSVGLFSKKPKSIIVPRPDQMAGPQIDPMAKLEQTLPIVTELPQLAPPPPKATPAKPPKPPKQMKQV